MSTSTPASGDAPATTSHSWGSCVHLLALQKVLGVMLPEEAQVSHLLGGVGRDRLTSTASPSVGPPLPGAGRRVARASPARQPTSTIQ